MFKSKETPKRSRTERFAAAVRGKQSALKRNNMEQKRTVKSNSASSKAHKKSSVSKVSSPRNSKYNSPTKRSTALMKRKSFIATPKSIKKKIHRASTVLKRPASVLKSQSKRLVSFSTSKVIHSKKSQKDMAHLNNEKKVLFDTANEKIEESSTTTSSIPTSFSASNNATNNQNVKVVARLRPLSTKEINERSREALIAHPKKSVLTLSTESNDKETRQFEYDAVFGPKTTQKQVYDSAAGDLIRTNIFKGFNVTILAYGQTGSGKTFTMGTEGGISQNGPQDDEFQGRFQSPTETDGVIPRAVYDIFYNATKLPGGIKNTSVNMSYLEIYNEEIRDLLTENTGCELSIRDTRDGVVVPNLSSIKVSSPQEVSAVMKQAAERRATASTAMNAVSSRSHAICTLNIVFKAEIEGKVEEINSKLTLVDLAGSERIKRTGAEGARMKEGININKGLFVLGQVVSALSEMGQKDTDNKLVNAHIPYRDSKLTRLLQDSLGGNSRTVMIACVSPANSNIDESTNTLRYATRTRNIKNTAVRNVVAKTLSAVEAAALRKENQMLKLKLLQAQEKISSNDCGHIASTLPAVNGLEFGINDGTQISSPMNALNIEKLEIVTRQKANMVSLQAKINHLEEKLDSANQHILAASTCSDKWQSQFEELSLLAKQNNIEIPTCGSSLDNDNIIVKLRNEIHELKSKLQDTEGDAIIARATAAAIIANDGNIEASEILTANSKVLDENSLDDDSQRRQLNEKLTSDLMAISKDIQMKEAMVAQTNKEREAMDSLKSHFQGAIQSLEDEVNVLTTERKDLVQKMERMEKIDKKEKGRGSDDTPVMKKMRQKVIGLEERMKDLRKKAAEHSRSLRLRDTAEKKCEQLKNEIADNKRRRTNLQKKLKEESVERRAEKKSAQAHAAKIMRDKQKLLVELNKVKQIAAKQTAVLRRKAAEALSRQKYQAEREKKRNAAAAMRSTISGSLSSQRKDELSQWIDREIQSSSLVKEIKNQIEEQHLKLDEAWCKKKVLEAKSSGDASVQSAIRVLDTEISNRESIISELESNTADFQGQSSAFADESMFNSLSKNELKLVDTLTFSRLIDTKHKFETYRSNHQQLITRKVNETTAKEKRKFEDTIIRLKMQHSEDMMSLLESTQGAVKSHVMLDVLENSESTGVDTNIKQAVDDMLNSYMDGCNRIGNSVREELQGVKETQDDMKKMVDQVAINLVAQNEKNATKKKRKKKRSIGLNEEEEKFVFGDDDEGLNEDSDDSDWDPEEQLPRARKRQRSTEGKSDNSIESTENVINNKVSSATILNENIRHKDSDAGDKYQEDNLDVHDTFKVNDTMKVSELKGLLRQKGLKVSGKKSDLLKRLRSPTSSDWNRQSEMFHTINVGKNEESDQKENTEPNMESKIEEVEKFNSIKYPLKARNLNDINSKESRLHEPVLKRTKPKAVASSGATKRRNLANALKASLKETELML